MKAKNSYSHLENRSYINTTLAVMGVTAGVSSLMVAWPALMHIGTKLL